MHRICLVFLLIAGLAGAEPITRPPAIPLIAPFLNDNDEGIRGMAAWSIIHIEGAHYVDGVET